MSLQVDNVDSWTDLVYRKIFILLLSNSLCDQSMSSHQSASWALISHPRKIITNAALRLMIMSMLYFENTLLTDLFLII